jgi:hypothetical protein
MTQENTPIIPRSIKITNVLFSLFLLLVLLSGCRGYTAVTPTNAPQVTEPPAAALPSPIPATPTSPPSPVPATPLPPTSTPGTIAQAPATTPLTPTSAQAPGAATPIQTAESSVQASPLPTVTVVAASTVLITNWQTNLQSMPYGCKDKATQCWLGSGSTSNSHKGTPDPSNKIAKSLKWMYDYSMITNQSIAVDPSWINPHLVFWQRYDLLYPIILRIKGSDQNDTWKQVWMSSNYNSPQWQQFNVDLGAYKGKAIQLQLITQSPRYWWVQDFQVVPDFKQ